MNNNATYLYSAFLSGWRIEHTEHITMHAELMKQDFLVIQKRMLQNY